MRRRGILDAIPLFIPAIPFAFVLGVAIVDSGLNELTGWSSSSIVYAGAAQLTLVSLLGAGAVGAAIAAALVVNLRHILYSLALAPAFQKQPAWFRWVGSALLIDQMFVLGERHKDDHPDDFRRYYLSAALLFLIGWNVFVAVGLVLGPAVPSDWGIAFAVPVMFTGMLIGGLAAAPGTRVGTRPDGRRRLDPKVVAAAVAAVTTVMAADLPHRSGLLIGAAAGIVAGLLASRVRR
jgi:predicted branched-subunit amino acid permease